MSLADIFTKSGIFLNVKWIFRMSSLPVLWRIFFALKQTVLTLAEEMLNVITVNRLFQRLVFWTRIIFITET